MFLKIVHKVKNGKCTNDGEELYDIGGTEILECTHVESNSIKNSFDVSFEIFVQGSDKPIIRYLTVSDDNGFYEVYVMSNEGKTIDKFSI